MDCHHPFAYSIAPMFSRMDLRNMSKLNDCLGMESELALEKLMELHIGIQPVFKSDSGEIELKMKLCKPNTLPVYRCREPQMDWSEVEKKVKSGGVSQVRVDIFDTAERENNPHYDPNEVMKKVFNLVRLVNQRTLSFRDNKLSQSSWIIEEDTTFSSRFLEAVPTDIIWNEVVFNGSHSLELLEIPENVRHLKVAGAFKISGMEQFLHRPQSRQMSIRDSNMAKEILKTWSEGETKSLSGKVMSVSRLEESALEGFTESSYEELKKRCFHVHPLGWIEALMEERNGTAPNTIFHVMESGEQTVFAVESHANPLRPATHFLFV
ncbi:hypothetical protein QR680_010510 [Steinernema hermaphroditum]|uniref:F-box associated domain-containing protein n=1 Tax=Steinernema hermaphroditum TaxID=289476 RepID=A0AA39IPA3_9BILA|nr:hypothetical protein QR680_010510 [Steinernema hermaphroditum]